VASASAAVAVLEIGMWWLLDTGVTLAPLAAHRWLRKELEALVKPTLAQALPRA
jgi:hypothetical protein